MSLSRDYQRDWVRYFDAVRDQPPRDTLLRALALSGTTSGGERVAIDLACGEGRDTRAMLAHAQDWRVWAVDACQDGLERLERSLRENERKRVQIVHATMEGVPLCPGLPRKAELLNASFALPFCHEDAFATLWDWMQSVLAGGGYFAGQFFGERDDWVKINPRRHVSRDQLMGLLADFEILHLDEVEKDGSDAMGGEKHHHVFHVVARRT